MSTLQDRIKNAEFAHQFTQTNLRYLLGDTPPNEEKVAACKAQLEARENEIKTLLASGAKKPALITYADGSRVVASIGTVEKYWALYGAATFKHSEISDFSHGGFSGTSYEVAELRGQALAQGLRWVAGSFGVTLRESLTIDSAGEISIIVSNGTASDGPKDFCGQYGEQFAELIAKHGPRCGYSPTTHLSPEGGWCHLNHFGAESMIHEFLTLKR